MIEKRGDKYVVISHKTGKKLGTYDTRALALAALRRMKHYGKKKGK